MELSYQNADARVSGVGGTSAKHFVAFIDSLVRRQYSISYVCLLAKHVLAFGRWCEHRGVSLRGLTDDHIEIYQRHRCKRRSRCSETQRRERRALQLLLSFLREQALCPAVVTPLTAVDKVIEDFARFLQADHGLAEATVENYTRITRQFLYWRFGNVKPRLRELRATDSIEFLRNEAKRLAPPALKNTVSALRAFLRYAQFCGEVSAALACGVPAVAGWVRTPPVPKAIAAEHAQRAIAGCNRHSAVGRRDRAVLLLLARLGLRACEIIRLTLDDIDWERAQLRVRSKGGSEALLPLPADVGETIAAYLTRGRPTSADRHLFLRSAAPIRGFKEGGDAIGTIVRDALKRAKVNAPHRGSHQFRHALAVQMLQRGASLLEIGQVLRHRSPQSTSIYAKVDLVALRRLAMPWPGGAR